MKEAEMKKVLEVGVLLCSERDLNRLLEKILDCVMELAHCDAGTLYLLDGDALRFKIMRNHTMRTYSGGDGRDPDLPPVPLRRENVCALAMLENRTIRVADVRSDSCYDFSGPIRYDAITGYHTQSMLVVPMHSREGTRIGVLQLINALSEDGTVSEFSEDMALVLESISSQASITIQNVRYIKEIKALFHSFVRAMSSAVDARTPYNGSHTRHMAAYGERFLNYLDTHPEGRRFTSARKEELLMSVWLHDIGKLVTPLEVMNKMARLTPEQEADFTHRMQVIRLLAKLRGEPEETARETREALEWVKKLNTAGFIKDEDLARLDKLRQRTYLDEDGEEKPWLEPEEYAMLSIRKGTLSDKERKIMEEHVVLTDKILSELHFSEDLQHVREWASAHHELLNGSGYPRHLTGDQIPYEVRIITILDIFDALVADDRPYKPGMPVEKALSILHSMAEQEGKLDPTLTKLFIESRCWEKGEAEA